MRILLQNGESVEATVPPFQVTPLPYPSRQNYYYRTVHHSAFQGTHSALYEKKSRPLGLVKFYGLEIAELLLKARSNPRLSGHWHEQVIPLQYSAQYLKNGKVLELLLRYGMGVDFKQQY